MILFGFGLRVQALCAASLVAALQLSVRVLRQAIILSVVWHDFLLLVLGYTTIG